jgi:hypothetical protein
VGHRSGIADDCGTTNDVKNCVKRIVKNGVKKSVKRHGKA